MGVGGLVRDGVGRWLGGFRESVGLLTNLEELLSVQSSLLYSWELGFRFVECEFYCGTLD